MLRGSKLAQMHSRREGDEKRWYLIPGGEVGEATAQKLLARPDVVQAGDAMFPGLTQTYCMVSRV